jgi:hypothetical protein
MSGHHKEEFTMRILAMTLATIGLTGGVALAQPREVVVRDRHDEVHYRDHARRPTPRIEHYAHRDGYNWHRGEWRWSGAEWTWSPGVYVRIRG